MEAKFIVAIGGSVCLMYFFILLVRRSFVLSVKKRNFSQAEPLNKNSQIGEFVRFSGRFAMPSVQEPVTNSHCGYWSLMVNAVFTSRRKSPSKGDQTHKPVIFRQSSDDAPFIVTNRKALVQMCLIDNAKALLNGEYQVHKHTSLPTYVPNELIKSKYRSYESKIVTIPKNSKAILWGTIKDKTQNSVLLGCGGDETKPPRIFLGSEKEAFQFFRKEVRKSFYGILWILGSLSAYYYMYEQEFEEVTFIVVVIVLAIAASFITRKIRKRQNFISQK